MARAIIGKKDFEVNSADESFTVNISVLFYGNGVPGGSDNVPITVQIPSTVTKAQAKTRIKNAIIAAASDMGYPFASQVIVSFDELFVGL